MRLQIISTTDGRFLGHEFEDVFPIQLTPDTLFAPDHPAAQIAPATWRFANSNYVIDAKEV